MATPDHALPADSVAYRGPGDAFWLHTSNPYRALTNLLERDRIFTDAVAVDAAGNGLSTVVVDGGRSVDELSDELAARFDLLR